MKKNIQNLFILLILFPDLVKFLRKDVNFRLQTIRFDLNAESTRQEKIGDEMRFFQKIYLFRKSIFENTNTSDGQQ